MNNLISIYKDIHSFPRDLSNINVIEGIVGKSLNVTEEIKRRLKGIGIKDDETEEQPKPKEPGTAEEKPKEPK